MTRYFRFAFRCLCVPGVLFALFAGSVASAAEADHQQAIAAQIDAGLPVDVAVARVLQQHPDAVDEVEAAAFSLMKTLPYSGSCDECGCQSGAAIVQYPMAELSDVEPASWVDAVVARYERAGEELMLPSYGQDEGFPFFYHFEAELKALRPYLGDQPADPARVTALVKQIEANGLREPVRFVLTEAGEGSHIADGAELMAAAARLGMQRLPVRFSFTDCAICENRSDSGHYSVDEMRHQSSLEWARSRFFDETEFVWVDKGYPSEYAFDYHLKPGIGEMLEYFSGPADEELAAKWKEHLQAGDFPLALPITLNYGAREVEFGNDELPSEEVHALLAAANDLGIQQYPALLSFQDQLTCRAGMRRTTYSAAELFPGNRVPLVAQRYFDDRRRMIFDEAGRNREARNGYPFAKSFPYHFMGNVDELSQYIAKQDMPKEQQIAERMKELSEHGLDEPLYLRLMRSKREREFVDHSALTIAAAERLGWEKLPIRVLYINHPSRTRTICDWLIRRVIDQYRLQEGVPAPSRDTDHSGGEVSPS